MELPNDTPLRKRYTNAEKEKRQSDAAEIMKQMKKVSGKIKKSRADLVPQDSDDVKTKDIDLIVDSGLFHSPSPSVCFSMLSLLKAILADVIHVGDRFSIGLGNRVWTFEIKYLDISESIDGNGKPTRAVGFLLVDPIKVWNENYPESDADNRSEGTILTSDILSIGTCYITYEKGFKERTPGDSISLFDDSILPNGLSLWQVMHYANEDVAKKIDQFLAKKEAEVQTKVLDKEINKIQNGSHKATAKSEKIEPEERETDSGILTQTPKDVATLKPKKKQQDNVVDLEASMNNTIDQASTLKQAKKVEPEAVSAMDIKSAASEIKQSIKADSTLMAAFCGHFEDFLKSKLPRVVAELPRQNTVDWFEKGLAKTSTYIDNLKDGKGVLKANADDVAKNEEVATLREELTQRKRKIAELEKEKKESERMREEYDNTIEENENKFRKLNEEKKKIGSMLEKMTLENEQFKQEYEKEKLAALEMKRANDKLHEAMATLNASRDEATRQTRELQEKYEGTRADNVKCLNTIKTMSGTLKTLFDAAQRGSNKLIEELDPFLAGATQMDI